MCVTSQEGEIVLESQRRDPDIVLRNRAAFLAQARDDAPILPSGIVIAHKNCTTCSQDFCTSNVFIYSR